jgi:hypothetical protein
MLSLRQVNTEGCVRQASWENLILVPGRVPNIELSQGIKWGVYFPEQNQKVHKQIYIYIYIYIYTYPLIYLGIKYIFVYYSMNLSCSKVNQ